MDVKQPTNSHSNAPVMVMVELTRHLTVDDPVECGKLSISVPLFRLLCMSIKHCVYAYMCNELCVYVVCVYVVCVCVCVCVCVYVCVCVCVYVCVCVQAPLC